MTYPDISNLHNLREFSEIYSNNPLIEENVNMKRYQILPVRYMSPENKVIRRFLIYHTPGTGKSFTALWIILNFINVYKKPSIILVKSKEAITEFTERVKAWYSYTFNYYPPLPNIENYKQFIKKYIDFRTYIAFCKSIGDDDDDDDNNDDKNGSKQTRSNSFSIYDDRLFIIDEVHHFRYNVGNKVIYNKLLLLLNHINRGRIIFMSATPIFDNANEIINLIKLIKPNLNSATALTPEEVKEEMLGHLSYYGLNPPNTSVNYIGSYIPGIQRYKIVKVPMQGAQLENYRKVVRESKNEVNIGVDYVKATLGVLHLNDNDDNDNDDDDDDDNGNLNVKSTSSQYILSYNIIINSNPFLQNIIRQQSKDLKYYSCKLYHCLKEINSKETPDGPVFIYCNIIEEVGIYYFSAILCAMGYHYVYDEESSNRHHNDEESSEFSNLEEKKVDKKSINGGGRFPSYHFPFYCEDDIDDDEKYEFAKLKEIRKERNRKFWNFTFITGDKRLCPNAMERLNMFNDPSNKNGSKIRVLLGSDVVSESVDIMNVRQLHVLTPHWNYEKINQIIGRIRRVGSHDSLPPEQRFANIYLYMACDDEVKCSNSREYSIDYSKYILCENKYNNALKYNQALQNASIESLVHAHPNLNDPQNTNGDIESNLSENRMMTTTGNSIDTNTHEVTTSLNNIEGNTLVYNTNIIPSIQLQSFSSSLKYSSEYLDKILPKYVIEINKKLITCFFENNSISIEDLLHEVPAINTLLLPKLIEYINSRKIVIAGGILEYSCGIIYRKVSFGYHLSRNNMFFEDLLTHSLPYYNRDKNKQINDHSSSFIYAKVDIKDEEIICLNDGLQNDINREVYDQIIKYSHTKKLYILKYALQHNLSNITKLFYPYWKKTDNFIYISYFSGIKNTSYASNKKRSVEDFSSNIIYTDLEFKKWMTLNDTSYSKDISNLMKEHYDAVVENPLKDRYKYVYLLCNDFTLRYRDLKNYLNFNAKKKKKKKTTSNNLRDINRGRNIKSFYKKEELMEVMIYSICYDDIEKKLSSFPIEGYKQVSAEKMEEICKEENNEDKYRLIKKHILNVVTQNNIPKYCNERPHQAFLLHKLLSSFSLTVKDKRPKIIELWKKYLFDYNLIIVL